MLMTKSVDAAFATMVLVVEADKIGSAASPLNLPKTMAVVESSDSPRAGDVVAVRALTDSATYNQLELPTGRLAKINPGDVIVGVLGSRRALKGFVAGACMNSGKTFAATELIRQATRAGRRVAAGKLSGVAALRDTLNMADHGATAVASFLDCGLPSTVGVGDLAPVAKAIIARLNESAPDLIVIELGDGILGGYSVESVFEDAELRGAMAALIYCASDYVGAWGGVELLKRRGLTVDLVAGSVTDSQMGEDYIEGEFNVAA